MKKKYLLLITVLSICFANAQYCPPTGFSTGNTVYFIYPNDGSSLCGQRPGTVTIGGSVFTLASCSIELSTYQLTSGAPVTDTSNFTVDFGGVVGNCQYTNNTLPVEEIDLINKESLSLYPNPLTTKDKTLKINLAIKTNASITIIDVNGKTVLTSVMKNVDYKKVNVSSLTEGVYLLSLKTNASVFSRKFVITNN